MRAVLLFALVAFVNARANVERTDRIIDVGETHNVNDDFDALLPSIVAAIVERNLDPTGAPDMSEGFNVQPLWVEYRAQLSLFNGLIHNTQSIRRSGDAVVATLHDLWRFRLPVAFDNLVINYDYRTQVMDIGLTGGVVGNVDKVSAVVDILHDRLNNEYHIQEFGFDSVGSIRIRLTGNPLTDWLVGPMIDVITTLFKSTMVQYIEETLRNELQTYLDNLSSSGSQKSWFPDLGSSISNANKKRSI